MKQKVTITVVVAIAAAVAAGGAAWKWRAATVKGSPSHQIAGWSWGNGQAKPNSHHGGTGV